MPKKSKKLVSVQDFFEYMDYEGGFVELFVNHGVDLDQVDMPKDIKKRLNAAIPKLKDAVEEINLILNELANDDI